VYNSDYSSPFPLGRDNKVNCLLKWGHIVVGLFLLSSLSVYKYAGSVTAGEVEKRRELEVLGRTEREGEEPRRRAGGDKASRHEGRGKV